MLKTIVAASFLAGASTIVAIPVSESPETSQPFVKTDRSAASVNRGVRNYLIPRLNGNRVAFCLTGGSNCGKSAADAFCRSNGFKGAITFQRDTVQSNSTKLRFRQIKCLNPQVVVTRTGVMTNAASKFNRL